jgi:hypothetical protein
MLSFVNMEVLMETRRSSVVLGLVQAGLLVLSAASFLVFASWMLGYNGLGLASGHAMPKQLSESNVVMHEPVHLLGAPGVATAAAGNHITGGVPNGEIRAGDGTSEFYGDGANLSFWAATNSQHAAWVAVRAVPPLGLAGIWWLLFLIVRSVRCRAGFTKSVARRIRIIGALVLVGVPLVQLCRWEVARWLVDSSSAAKIAVVEHFQLELWPLAVGLVILVMASAWSEAAKMREDLEGLV